jgi:hypothetical protein
MDDDVEPSDRKFFSLADKLLLSMPGFRAANERMTDALLNMLPQLSEFMNTANKKNPELTDSDKVGRVLHCLPNEGFKFV